MNTNDLPVPREGLVLTHFLTVSDVARSPGVVRRRA